MEPEMTPANATDALEATDLSTVEVENSSAIVAQPETPTQESSQWQETQRQIALFLDQALDNVGIFFVEFQRPIITILLVLGAVISVKLILALLDAIDEMPLLAALLKFIGFSYTLWFSYRYLFLAENRQELVDSIQAFRDQILGKGQTNS